VLETITKAEYAEQPKQYKPRKKAEQNEYNDIFYKNQENNNGWEFVEARGRLMKYGGYDFYITKGNGKNPSYNITEGKTGIRVTEGSTLKEAQDKVKDMTHNLQGGRAVTPTFSERINQAIEQYGISPLYA
jgi:hypothetical protein